MIGHTIADYVARQREWSFDIFGPGARLGGLTKHIAKELQEILERPNEVMEWVDVVILALDGAWRAGYTPKQIQDAMERKQQINFKRRWPTPESEDEPVEHI